MIFGIRLTALSAAVIACAALAGCSSPSPADKQIAAERSAVLPVAMRIYEQLYGAHVAWGYDIQGLPALCGVGDPLAPSTSNLSEIQYSTEQIALPYAAGNLSYYSLRPPMIATQFAPMVIQELEAHGWKLRLLSKSGTNPTYTYGVRSGGLDIVVDISQEAADVPTANLQVSGACFNAGSSAGQMINNPKSNTDTVTVPHPSQPSS
jgi:hypothetical protein